MIKRSIRNKLILLLLVVTIVPFSSAILITYYHTKDILQKQSVQETSNLLYQGKYNLENYINQLNKITLNLYNNADFMNYMKYPTTNNNLMKVELLKGILNSLLYSEEYIQKVQISFADDNRVISTTKQSTIVFSDSQKQGIEQAYMKAKNSPYNMYLETRNTYNALVEHPQEGITVHRAFFNVPTSNILAYISIEISPDKIYELSKKLYNSNSEEFFILSAEGEIIYSSRSDITTATKDQQLWVETLLKSDAKSGQMEWQEGAFHGMVIYDRLSDSAGGWILVKRIPHSILYESAFNVAKINIIFGGFGLILAVLLTLFISFKITSPIRVLLQNIQEIEKGNMEIQFKSLGSDEIGILGSRFKQMIEKINHLIKREYKLELENKTNQLKVLQSQINPHFLYNALQSIGTVALKNQVPQIYTLITHLSKIMRYGMDMKDSTVPLIKEINYTKAFLLLQKERFGDYLDYSIDVSENVMNIHVPKMILQPVIENYFKHGFESRDGIGKIKIECKKQGKYLHMIISDNGGGITKSRLNEVYHHIQQEKQITGEETNIGLKNIFTRIKLYYGEAASLLLENNQEGGFLVTIKLPISSGGDKDESNNR
ncbi:sensor histidine kinase [Anaerobacillus isosaccharinicus]|uniref:histidine kinase n=1 Tax=Anaerobacillus isosaccharinicus TaxID=1532552 RepID=A0A7S7LC76_9BACI|nr:sensor histidine kinase [Anaerobacillus isosaccharinicus]MBA5588349.1 sensor histidine kinase [Anaerobacillus isosaccharinicus]QOY38216.1 sensor histidine kinase [Anaerobacillus isosaccharinicus]